MHNWERDDMCPVSVLTDKQALIFLASLEVQFLGSRIFGRPMFQKIWGYSKSAGTHAYDSVVQSVKISTVMLL